MELKINPELEKVIAKMTESEYETLKASIAEEGLKQEIEVMADGTIIDGHHRYKACQELGIEPRYKVIDSIKTLQEAIAYAVVINIARRHLNSFQKAEMGMPLLEVEKELAKQRQREKFSPIDEKSSHGATAIGQVAKKIGLSEKTFERAKKVIEEGSKELKDLVREEKLTIYGAYSLITALEDVPKKAKEALESRVTNANNPEEELSKVLDIIGKTNRAKGYLEMTDEEIAKEIEEKYKDLYYTEYLDPQRVRHDIQIAEGVETELKKIYLPEDRFKDEIEADKFAKKFGGRCLGKVTTTLWILEVDPYEYQDSMES